MSRMRRGVYCIAILMAAACSKTPPTKVAATVVAPISPLRSIIDCPDCPELLVLPKGSFVMGNADTRDIGYPNRTPAKKVAIDYALAFGKFEVTQAQWRTIMGENPSGVTRCGEDCPVEKVSWGDVQKYLTALNKKTGLNFRLPTEAEWEYAARSTTTSKYEFGNDPAQLPDYAWLYKNGGDRTHKVGMKKPNAWGLYDTIGNVAEWVQDCFQESYSYTPIDGSAQENSNCQSRVYRGSDWSGSERIAELTIRGFADPTFANLTIGFRVVRNVDAKE
jgi:formylglycine-generating enzyme required for sulfatase activity